MRHSDGDSWALLTWVLVGVVLDGHLSERLLHCRRVSILSDLQKLIVVVLGHHCTDQKIDEEDEEQLPRVA